MAATTKPSGASAASVQLLTAEVRTLVVGKRQVTMSVYKQLDSVPWNEVEAFGRVAVKSAYRYDVHVVGRHRPTGALVASCVSEVVGRTVDVDEPFPNEPWMRANVDGCWSPSMWPSVVIREGDGWRCAFRPEVRAEIVHDGALPKGQAVPLTPEIHATLRNIAAQQIREGREQQATWEAWTALPKIVLAGLR